MPQKKVIISTSDISNQLTRPALTPEARENQMISLAMDAAEKQLKDGTASSQIIVHFLKLATKKEELEIEKIQLEKEAIKAKTESLKSEQRVEELYANALKAMQSYSGGGPVYDEEEQY